MNLTDAQLAELRKRCIQATLRGHAIANVESYLNSLSVETGMVETPFGIQKGSAEHLRVLVEEAQAQRSGKKARPAPKKVMKPEPVKKVEAPKPVQELKPVLDKPKEPTKTKKSKKSYN
jgi:hypothetical protein